MTKEDYIEQFLTKNGFTKISDKKYESEKYQILIRKKYYQVNYNDEHNNYWFVTHTISIPELLGYLLFNNLISRDFII